MILLGITLMVILSRMEGSEGRWPPSSAGGGGSRLDRFLRGAPTWKKIGIGIIGSRFAAELHAHALSKLRGVKCEILAVCSKTRESAEAFARKFNIPYVYTDHRACWSGVTSSSCRCPW